jgi:hypothetical protein
MEPAFPITPVVAKEVRDQVMRSGAARPGFRGSLGTVRIRLGTSPPQNLVQDSLQVVEALDRPAREGERQGKESEMQARTHAFFGLHFLCQSADERQ